jgi:hypothetical protein
MVRFLPGDDVESVYSVGRVTAVDEGGQGEDPDTAMTLLRLKDGAIASIDNSRRSALYNQRARSLVRMVPFVWRTARLTRAWRTTPCPSLLTAIWMLTLRS